MGEFFWNSLFIQINKGRPLPVLCGYNCHVLGRDKLNWGDRVDCDLTQGSSQRSALPPDTHTKAHSSAAQLGRLQM